MENSNVNILVVDDERLIRESLYEILRIDGFGVYMAPTAEEGLELLKKHNIDVVITDLKLPKMDGITFLKHIKEINDGIEVVVITGYASVETAVDAMKIGAYDYVTKPINDNEIKLLIQRVVERKSLVQENQQLKGLVEKGARDSFCDMIGSSPKMQELYNLIDAIASTNASILVSGESGTGKGLVAKAIHKTDRNRREKPFVEVSCGALTETLLESELFGHMKGSFTGAIKDKEGRFEYAHGGTIFLDEIDAFSPKLQVKLLKVLQDGEFERVGDNLTRKTNARVIVATNQSLTELVKSGDFREDLYYRINVITVQLPPLRERKEDIEHIVNFYLKKYSKVNNRAISGVSNDVLAMFQNYPWPGNIRELENAVEGAVIMCPKGIVEKTHVPNLNKFDLKDSASHVGASSNVSGLSLRRAVELPEKEHIIEVLESCGWNRNKAALKLGVNRTTLYNKMKKYKITNESKG